MLLQRAAMPEEEAPVAMACMTVGPDGQLRVTVAHIEPEHADVMAYELEALARRFRAFAAFMARSKAKAEVIRINP